MAKQSHLLFLKGFTVKLMQDIGYLDVMGLKVSNVYILNYSLGKWPRSQTGIVTPSHLNGLSS